ncbi:MAG TPA: 3'(2'),5'-bisphosphate nucleotidase [Rheinheimera sp.]|uniref:3'(2'),5'-bisphosphate nucleotidase CysQ n=1 Tax=Rheinheimera sp. TaxID=1869214 RepID=UPI000ED7B4FD|nr:3'(2'),5'-bisphosphate nucleotidase CysQ [Rheinheimera sp.]HCU65557.1 3'(2'),5'-bisphosphate nucleotidase [Rheinheimera sp.]
MTSYTPTQQQLSQWLPQICQIAVAAGNAILAIYHQPEVVAVQHKADDSPLTAADLAAHQLIMRELSVLTPDIPVLSEEAADIPWSVRQHWPCYWLVDPLDGTKEFIKRNGEFTVNIALIVAGEPVLGVIHAPVLQKTYSAVLGLGAFVAEVDAQGQTQSRVIQAKKPVEGEPVKIVGSRSHAQPGMDAVLAKYPQHELLAVGSSLKFCLVAEGSAHLYPRLGPTMLWDTGAGHVIAVAAGASVSYDGIEGPAYQREELQNGNFTVQA